MNAEQPSVEFPAASSTVELQHVGPHMAVRVEELVVGCVVVWNGGGQSLVTEIARVSKCFVNVSLRPLDWTLADGFVLGEKTYVRKMKTSRVVGYSPATTKDYAASRVEVGS